MKKGPKILVGAAASLALIMTPVVASATEYDFYGAICISRAANTFGTSTFTADQAGWYTWVWRTGKKINGGGVAYLQIGETWEGRTPSRTDGSTRFGVLTTTSSTFAYVTCAG